MSGFRTQILAQQLAALTREGAGLFVAMSRSALVVDEGQYACAILDGDGRLVAQDQGEPSHLAAVQSTVAHVLDAFAFNLSDGDVVLAGDPYCGGTWGGVLTLVRPFFHGGDLRFLAALRFAVPDLAGDIPGPYQPGADEIWQEALRVTPVKLVEAGAAQQDVRQYLLRNSRTPSVLDNDLTVAAVVAAHVGARLSSMVGSRGLEAVLGAAKDRIAYSARRARVHLGGITAGAAREDEITVRVVPSDAGVVIDLDGTAPAAPDATNLALGATRAVALAQLAWPLIEDDALAQGLLDAVEIRCPPDCLLAPHAPAAVSLGWRVTAPRLAATLARAIGEAPVIAPSAPLLMLFEPIGSAAESHPVRVSPGFVPMPGAAGSDAAAGRRRLASAELTEMAGTMAVHRREATNAGMAAELVVTGAGLEAVIVPGAEEPMIAQDAPLGRPRSNVLSLQAGARISFDYPTAPGDARAGQ